MPKDKEKYNFRKRDKLAIDPVCSKKIETLAQINPLRALTALIWDWTVIALIFVFCLVFTHPVIWFFGIFAIACRQHALLILMHDASHFRLFKNHWWNDHISNWFFAYPLFITTDNYRSNHLRHHAFLNTDKDPDWVRKSGKKEWEFPKTRSHFFRLLMKDLLGGSIIELLKGIHHLGAKNSSFLSLRALYYCLPILVISVANLWLPILILWIVPVFFVLPVILRIRSIAEHFGVPNQTQLDMSRNTLTNFLENIFLTPHSSGLHLDHHLYPAVPFYNLTQLHSILAQNADYNRQAKQNVGLFGARSVYRDVVG